MKTLVLAGFAVAVAVAALAACGTPNDDAPSCQDAVGHYYSAGCMFHNNSGSAESESQFETNCQNTVNSSPENCADELDAFLNCLDDVPDATDGGTACNCSTEQTALNSCE